MSRVGEFIKREITFVLSFLLTAIVVIVNKPRVEYLYAIDFKILALLLSLMIISEGLEESMLFNKIRSSFTQKVKSERSLALILVFLSFFLSSFITNDVALIVLVPFTLALLKRSFESKKLIKLLVLETISANLGSMILPIGNPQNLFLYTRYNLDFITFLKTIIPYSLFSGVIIVCSTIIFFKKSEINICIKECGVDKRKSALFILFLLLALLSLFKLFNVFILLLILVIYLLLFDRRIFKSVDYILLLTFVCFFIFSDALSSNISIKELFTSLMQHNGVITTILTSQIISNVPASILLSEFTANYKDLLIGANIGGLGTPIASLASLITIKYYMSLEKRDNRAFFTSFLAFNLIILALLIIFHFIFDKLC